MPAKRSRSEPAPAAKTGRATPVSKATTPPAGTARRGGKAAPAPTRRGVTAEVYNRFIAGVDLVSIRLVGAEIEAGSAPEHRHLLPRIGVHGTRFTNEDDHVVVVHELGFIGTYEDEDDPVVSIRAAFEVRYSATERMTDEIFAEFRRRNLPLNTWPYFREFVHAALARTGWPVFVLPVYKASDVPLSPAGE